MRPVDRLEEPVGMQPRHSSVRGGPRNGQERRAAVLDAPYAKARVAKEGPRTYINYGEDPDFAPTLIALEDAARALAPKIAVFREMKTMEEKRAFYKLASDKLFNYAHDVRAAYAAQLKKGMFK